MPHLFSFASHGSEDALQEMGDDLPQKPPRRPSLLKNLGGLWKRHHDQRDVADPCPHTAPPEQPVAEDYFEPRRSSLPDSCVPRRAVPSLPRPQTFRRQESEKREKLLEVPPSPTERRAVSVDRRRGLSASAARRPLSPKPVPLPSVSAPEIVKSDQETKFEAGNHEHNDDTSRQARKRSELTPLQIPDARNGEVEINNDEDEREYDESSVQEEYNSRWILNLSMHFRDKSNREKFFVTYAETPTRWRRLTVSLDYRNAPEGSLEADLSTLHYQRDKSFQIYQAIRESLPEIQYYNTVTNLKLETTPEDGQLHVHVREDANEIIHYPSKDLFRHVRATKFRESEVEFISHLSGFVYKVRTEEKILIKKEIPGPDTVDEFLYEVNALNSLLGSRHVVQLEGLVTDEAESVVKGLLISYASEGAMVDMIFDEGHHLEWHRREKWAMQIVEGLSNIHEAGFVQGDFTLSNIVIDGNDDAAIIDINRRGCPVGWEPPELGLLIDSGQRIGMCIGVKTDLYQLGMVLWALAECVDEPERVERPLPTLPSTTPTYYRRMVECCLSERPQGRSSAKHLLRKFPLSVGRPASQRRPSTTVEFLDDVKLSDHSVSTHRSDKEYIDPDMAITLEDVSSQRRRRDRDLSPFLSEQVTYFDPQDPESNPASTTYRFESSGSWIVGHRGRSPLSSRRRRSSPYARSASSSSSATSLSGRSPPSRSRRRCGSESSENDRAQESPVERGWEPESQGSAPTIIATTEEKPLQNKLLTGVQSEDCQPQSSLLHTDSGFDEQMAEQVNLEPATDSAAREDNASVAEDVKLEHLPNGIEDKENHPTIPADLPTQPPSDQAQTTLEPECQFHTDREPQINGLKTPTPTQAATTMDSVPALQLDMPTVDSDLKQAVLAPTADTDPQPQSEEAADAGTTKAIAQSEYYEARQT